jgi:hypothetical protein
MLMSGSLMTIIEIVSPTPKGSSFELLLLRAGSRTGGRGLASAGSFAPALLSVGGCDDAERVVGSGGVADFALPVTGIFRSTNPSVAGMGSRTTFDATISIRWSVGLFGRCTDEFRNSGVGD